jgi:hypothetical protein
MKAKRSRVKDLFFSLFFLAVLAGSQEDPSYAEKDRPSIQWCLLVS